jgi:hypothetical protein
MTAGRPQGGPVVRVPVGARLRRPGVSTRLRGVPDPGRKPRTARRAGRAASPRPPRNSCMSRGRFPRIAIRDIRQPSPECSRASTRTRRTSFSRTHVRRRGPSPYAADTLLVTRGRLSARRPRHGCSAGAEKRSRPPPFWDVGIENLCGRLSDIRARQATGRAGRPAVLRDRHGHGPWAPLWARPNDVAARHRRREAFCRWLRKGTATACGRGCPHVRLTASGSIVAWPATTPRTRYGGGPAFGRPPRHSPTPAEPLTRPPGGTQLSRPHAGPQCA